MLRGESSILMVDCGGEAPAFSGEREKAQVRVFPSLFQRYEREKERSFLLTHYHGDRVSALKSLLKRKEGFFHRFFFPTMPPDRYGRPLLLEYSLFLRLFLPEEDVTQGGILDLFSGSAAPAPGGLRLLGQGDSFSFDGITYQVLWPQKENYSFSPLFREAAEALDVCVSSPFLPEAAALFRQRKQKLGEAFLACAGEPTRENIEKYGHLLEEILAMKEEFCSMPFAPDLREILSREVNRLAFSQELDGAGLIFQNARHAAASLDDILMMGDATPETLDRISSQLYENYFIVKAPAGGRQEFWSHVLGEISCQHILVSRDGEAAAVAEEYRELPGILHCTHPEGCPFYVSSGCSCNRIRICYDLKEGAGLTIRCPLVSGKKEAGCGIWVIGEGKERACLCDSLPAVIH